MGKCYDGAVTVRVKTKGGQVRPTVMYKTKLEVKNLQSLELFGSVLLYLRRRHVILIELGTKVMERLNVMNSMAMDRIGQSKPERNESLLLVETNSRLLRRAPPHACKNSNRFWREEARST
jgi:hypothetical protein